MTSPSGGDQYQQGAGAPGTPHGPKITSIFDFSAEALEQVAFWLEQRGLHIPVAQLLGFSQFTAQAAPTIHTTETTTSSTYTDLATVGPKITGLSDGKYVLFFGCTASTSAPGVNGANMTIQVNAVAPSGGDDLITLSGSLAPGSYALVKTLSNGGNNTLTAKYLTGGGATATYRDRWLVALRYANS